jgi:predicted acylesterase/phospholipase RssA
MESEDKLPPNIKTIKHIVLSGGGGTGFAYYGALRESHKDGFWNIDNIQTMHGVSCGAIFVAFISMLNQIGWDDYDDFCIKRPWESVLDFSAEKLLNAYSNVGICDRESVKNIFLPLLNAIDITIEITMRKFY